MKILFFPVGDATLASSRSQVYERVEELKKRGIKADILGKKERKNRIVGNKDRYLLFPFVFWRYDIIFFQKNFNLLDFILLKLCKFFNKKVIFHTDDYFPDAKEKIKRMCRGSDMVLVCSHFLKEILHNINKNTHIIPTGVDTERFKIKEIKGYKKDKIVVLGWLGHSMFENLKIIQKPLQELNKKFNIELKIVGDIDRSKLKTLVSEGVPIKLTGWLDHSKVQNEISTFDIGLMPCPDDLLHKAAMPIKLLEYMSCGLPTVSSSVGEMKYIIKDNKNGFLAKNENEWIKKLEKLIKNRKLRERIGKNARETIIKKYSLKITTDRLLYLIEKYL